MKLNRFLCILMCVLFAFSIAYAEGVDTENIQEGENAIVEHVQESEDAPVGDTQDDISTDEILEWANKIYDNGSILENIDTTKVEEEELGFALKTDSFTLYYNSADIQNAQLLAIRVTEPLFEGPRGEMLYDEQNELLKIYPNDNIDLVGDRDFAVLYLSTQMPQKASYGIVSRDGQKIKNIEYYVHEQKPSGMYSNMVLSFEIENNSIESISAYGFLSEISQEEVHKNIQNISAKMQNKDYFAYKTSSNGLEIDPFEREDLIFNDIDFLSLSADTLIEKLGEPDTDEQGDIEGKKYRTLTWNALDASFSIEDGKEKISRINITDKGVDGPRRTEIGDSFSSVYSRFRFEGNPVNDENKEVLYGTEGEGNYATAMYYPNGMELIYHNNIEIESNKFINTLAIFNFSGDKLNEISLIMK